MAGSPVIDIAADNVDIDLNGFTLSGAAGAPVVQSLGRDNVSIRRGKLMGGAYGVLMTSLTGGTHVTIEDLTVEGWTGFGIWLDGTTGFSIRRNKIGGPGVGEGIFALTSFGGRTSGLIEGNQVFNGARKPADPAGRRHRGSQQRIDGREGRRVLRPPPRFTRGGVVRAPEDHLALEEGGPGDHRRRHYRDDPFLSSCTSWTSSSTRAFAGSSSSFGR